MKLYTRRGDDGQTDLLGLTRVLKNDPRVEAYGLVDELNSVIGWTRCVCDEANLNESLGEVQKDLFVLGADLATPSPNTSSKDETVSLQKNSKKLRIDEKKITQLEHWIDEACDPVEPLRYFILPGGCELAARLHLARAACRRAERQCVATSQTQTINPWAITYLNRLSDLLFAWARLANHQASVKDIPWHPEA